MNERQAKEEMKSFFFLLDMKIQAVENIMKEILKLGRKYTLAFYLLF